MKRDDCAAAVSARTRAVTQIASPNNEASRHAAPTLSASVSGSSSTKLGTQNAATTQRAATPGSSRTVSKNRAAQAEGIRPARRQARDATAETARPNNKCTRKNDARHTQIRRN